MIEHTQSFRDAMAAAGIIFKGDLIADGKLKRVHVDGDNPGSRNSWYVLHLDGTPAGAFGCKKRMGDEKIKWSAKGTKPLTKAERKAISAKVKADRDRREADEADKSAEAAAKAQAIWDGAQEAPPSHQYLTKKGVQAHGVRVGTWPKESPPDPETGEIRPLRINDALLVPVCDFIDGKRQIVSLQAIFPDSENPLGRGKDFLTGGKKSGCYHVVGKPIERGGLRVMALTEGYATAASVYEATGVGVIVAFDAG